MDTDRGTNALPEHLQGASFPDRHFQVAAAAPHGKRFSGWCLAIGPGTHEHPAAPNRDLEVRLQLFVRKDLDIGHEVPEPIDVNDFPFHPVLLCETRRGCGLEPFGEHGSKLLDWNAQGEIARRRGEDIAAVKGGAHLGAPIVAVFQRDNNMGRF
jgi:hypothetical protein